jgi:hypothetical protein
MMRKYIYFVFLAVIVAVTALSCSKTAVPGPIVDYWTYGGITGKWAFEKGTDPSAADPMFDTLLFEQNFTYALITLQDTADRGTFTVGYSEAVNGFGNRQGYDSLGLKTVYLTQAATYPKVLYFKQTSLDTISISTRYKDSAQNQAITYYTRVK